MTLRILLQSTPSPNALVAMSTLISELAFLKSMATCLFFLSAVDDIYMSTMGLSWRWWRKKCQRLITSFRDSQRRLTALVVDEAHCALNWGDSFRPAYCELKRKLKFFDQVPRMALTAAAPVTQIAEYLGFSATYRTVFMAQGAPNIFLSVIDKGERLKVIFDLLRNLREKAGLVALSQSLSSSRKRRKKRRKTNKQTNKQTNNLLLSFFFSFAASDMAGQINIAQELKEVKLKIEKVEDELEKEEVVLAGFVRTLSLRNREEINEDVRERIDSSQKRIDHLREYRR